MTEPTPADVAQADTLVQGWWTGQDSSLKDLRALIAQALAAARAEGSESLRLQLNATEAMRLKDNAGLIQQRDALQARVATLEAAVTHFICRHDDWRAVLAREER